MMKKKLISTLLCTSMVAALAAGCGGGDGDSEGGGDAKGDSDKTTLTMWLPPLDEDTENNFKPLLADFEEENNCEVKMELIPWASYEEKWSTAISGGEGPDIGYMYAEMYPTYISSGAVVDLTDMMEDADYDEYLYLDRGEMMGGLYGIPIVTGVPFVLYYNQEILDSLEETAPETWEDFARICEKATKDTDGDGEIDQY